MAYVVERRKDDGTPRYLAQYRDPEGRICSAGTHPSRRAAEGAGNWHEHTLGAIAFRAYDLAAARRFTDGLPFFADSHGKCAVEIY